MTIVLTGFAVLVALEQLGLAAQFVMAIGLIVLAVGASTWAFYIAALNAAARVLFAMGREGVLPASLAQVSSR